MIPDFHLVALELQSEEKMLAQALHALDAVDAGETVFFPEYLAWTPRGSGRAFATLIAEVQQRNINVVTTLNVGPDLHQDLPGADSDARYNALTIFTRFGFAHTPQAKLTPHSFEQLAKPGESEIGVSRYSRINRVRLDWQDELIDVRFIIDSDLMVLTRFSPEELRCDLLVVLGRFPRGAERAASRLLAASLTAGVARSTLLVNAFDGGSMPALPERAIKVEEVLDATGHASPRNWPSSRAIRAAFYSYEGRTVADFAALSDLPRRGRIAVIKSLWKTEITLAEYPITISL